VINFIKRIWWKITGKCYIHPHEKDCDCFSCYLKSIPIGTEIKFAPSYKHVDHCKGCNCNKEATNANKQQKQR